MRLHPLVPTVAVIGLAILWVPLVVMVALSFNGDRLGRGYDPSVAWYLKLLGNAEIHRAALNSLILAVTSTVCATLLGTGMALGLHRAPWPRAWRGFFDVNIPSNGTKSYEQNITLSYGNAEHFATDTPAL